MAERDSAVHTPLPPLSYSNKQKSHKSSSARKSGPLTPEPLPSRGQVTKRLFFAGEEGGGKEGEKEKAAEDDLKTPLYESPPKKPKSHPSTDNENEEKSSGPKSKRVLDFASTTKSVRRSSRLQKPDEVEAPTSPLHNEPVKSSIRISAKKTTKKQPKSATITPARHKPSKKSHQRARRLKCVAQKTEHADRIKNKVTKKACKGFSKVVFDGVEFRVGDCVYVRRQDSSSDSDEADCEECQICSKVGKGIMVECDECLGGFHLSCLKPPLKQVPQDKWLCPYCERNEGNTIQRRRRRKTKKTAREKLLNSQLWAARIDRLWKEPGGSYRFTGRWFIIPEETTIGRQPHNLKRELFQTNHFDDNEMESILRHCYVKGPKEFEKCTEGDDVFLCEYEYDINWHAFKRLADADVDEESNRSLDSENDWNSSEDSGEDDFEDEEEDFQEKPVKAKSTAKTPCSQKSSLSVKAVNTYRGCIIGLEKIGTKKIPDRARCRRQTDLDRAKATLMLAASPGSLPCRNKEIDEITGFVMGALAAGSQCLGRCLYIHGVPGTGKTATVLTVMKKLRAKVDAKVIQPYRFVEINGLKLAQPENLYKVLYEALTGHRVSWKKALQFLNQRFSETKQTSKNDCQPCILLIDELDLLVTRNQSVLYNIFDWPTRAHSQLIVIGIANTMDLPEKLLPRIASRMGMQRLCFGPYSYQQLQEIISSRLNGIEAFEKQAVEFVSRKVAAVSGDARRALELCRRAAELAEFRVQQCSISLKTASNELNVSGGGTLKNLVGMADIEAAIHEMFQAPHIQQWFMRTLKQEHQRQHLKSLQPLFHSYAQIMESNALIGTHFFPLVVGLVLVGFYFVNQVLAIVCRNYN
ncbi:origin of replication complex subunit 1 isoform X2 [Cryptomeria japonica]|uniref:origin of replication complex subunit 1 isoform X2 n=1 Tax=Cryptomeria japonica TaxID=3369 RepID=UPI0027DA2D85|nr:origin of replication complex subunit 1 isoform X2 [Cryptomeria japonica]